VFVRIREHVTYISAAALPTFLTAALRYFSPQGLEWSLS